MNLMRRRRQAPAEPVAPVAPVDLSGIIPEVGAWVTTDGLADAPPFEIDRELKDSKPVDFSHLRGASEPEMRAAFAELTSWYPWYHRIELPYGIVTPGARDAAEAYEAMGVSEHIRGKTVLDLGTMDGAFAFLCERDGAQRVVGLDVDNVLEYDLSLGLAYVRIIRAYLDAKQRGREAEWRFLNSRRFGFAFCHACLQSSVERVHDTVYNVSPERLGMFDVSLFVGILYHLPSPLRALEAVFSVTKERTFVESEISLAPALGPNGCAFYRQGYDNDDVTNWFVPTPRCLMDMVLSVGYRRARYLGRIGGRAWVEAEV